MGRRCIQRSARAAHVIRIENPKRACHRCGVVVNYNTIELHQSAQLKIPYLPARNWTNAMNILVKCFAGAVVGAMFAIPAPAFAQGLPVPNAMVGQLTAWVVSGLQFYVAHAANTSTASPATRAPSVTIIGGNHMIIEAKRLAPDSTPFHGLSGPRKKQPRS